MKKCCRCKLRFKFTEFYKDKKNIDGLRSNCKKCHKKSTSDSYYKDKPDRKDIFLFKKERPEEFESLRIQNRKEARKLYIEKNRSRINERARRYSKTDKKRKWRSEYEKKYRKRPNIRQKINARAMVDYRVRTGKIIKQPCEVCGEHKVHGHHEDYSKPLEVLWLCEKHHLEIHSKRNWL